MPSRAEIARYLNVDPSYVTRLVQRGMPLDSFELAKEWRATHASKRAPPNPKKIVQQIAQETDDDSQREELGCRGILIPLAAARDMAHHGYDAILGSLLCLPQ